MPGFFKVSTLTQKGLALLSKSQAGRTEIKIKKVGAGCGTYSESEMKNLSFSVSLKDPRQFFHPKTITVINETNVSVVTVFKNQDEEGNPLKNGYHMSEIGIYAEDPDEGEILYCIAVAEEGKSDWMPSYNGILPASNTIEFVIEVANSGEVSIENPSRMYLYDDATGKKFVIGVENKAIYYQEVDE